MSGDLTPSRDPQETTAQTRGEAVVGATTDLTAGERDEPEEAASADDHADADDISSELEPSRLRSAYMEDHPAKWHWHPEPRWLMLSLLGVTAGGFTGAVYVVVVVIATFLSTGVANYDPGGALMGILGLAVFGAVGGAVAGLVAGVAVGFVLTFLVGRDMPGRAAMVLSFAGAAATVALLMWLVVRILDGVYQDHLALIVSASAVAAGLVAMWFRGQLPLQRGSTHV